MFQECRQLGTLWQRLKDCGPFGGNCFSPFQKLIWRNSTNETLSSSDAPCGCLPFALKLLDIALEAYRELWKWAERLFASQVRGAIESWALYWPWSCLIRLPLDNGLCLVRGARELPLAACRPGKEPKALCWLWLAKRSTAVLFGFHSATGMIKLYKYIYIYYIYKNIYSYIIIWRREWQKCFTCPSSFCLLSAVKVWEEWRERIFIASEIFAVLSGTGDG